MSQKKVSGLTFVIIGITHHASYACRYEHHVSPTFLTNRHTYQCTEAFAISHIEVIDFSDGACSGAKLELIIVSPDFAKVPLIQRHRKVQALLKEDGLMDEKIHALTIKAWTPEQWEAKK